MANQKLKQPLYVLHILTNGDCDWVGEVISETDTTIRMELCDCLSLWGGLWQLSGEVKDVPKAECRLFRDHNSVATALGDINRRFHERETITTAKGPR